MKLNIITPQTKESHTVAWVEVMTSVGSFVIQKGHAPMVLALAPEQPVIFRLTNGKQEQVVPLRGFIEVNRTEATLLINDSTA